MMRRVGTGWMARRRARPSAFAPPRLSAESAADGSATGQSEDDYGLELGWDKADHAVRTATVRQISSRLPAVLRDAYLMAWRVDRRSVLALLICQALAGAAQAGGLLATTGVLGVLVATGSIGARLHAALPSLLIMAGASTVRALLGLTVAALSRRVAPQLTAEAEALLLRGTAGAELVAFEKKGFGERGDAAERGANEAANLVSSAQDMIASIASLVAASFVVSVLHPILLPVLALGIVPRWISLIRAQHVEYTSNQQSIPDRRMMGALRWYLTDRYPADQIRAGTMAPFLLGRYAHHARLVREREHAAAWRSAKIAALGSAVAGLSSLLLWATLLGLLVTHRMSPVRAGTAVVALQAVSTALWGLVVAASRLFRTSVYLADWKAYLEETAKHRLVRGSTIPKDVQEFRATKVTFTYPDADRPALDGVDFQVSRGEIVGLVGMNGSGKTTLTRLLAGLYLPDGGSVSWDGHDVRDLDPMAAWQLLAYVPQQYTKLPVTLGQNITLGQPHDGGVQAVLDAAKAAGADRVIAKQKLGLDTMMARSFWGSSSDLSGGEWQRVVLSRAFYRRSDLLILDEPTSALDAEGEALIIQGLRAQSQGRATVLVSHRLSCLRYVDRVVVMSEGRICEEGSLKALLATEGGELARLWNLQEREAAGPPQAPSPMSQHVRAPEEERVEAAALAGPLADAAPPPAGQPLPPAPRPGDGTTVQHGSPPR